MNQQPVQSAFVIGPSGCGTTMIGRILAASPSAAAIAGNHAGEATTPEPLRDCSAWLDDITTRLWAERATFAERAQAERDLTDATAVLIALAERAGITRLIWKRSTPFHNDNDHAPHLRDLVLFPGDPRLVIVTRDPRASAGSTLRRDHHDGLRRAAVVCEQRWTQLAAQAEDFGPGRCLHIRYEQFCRDPHAHAAALAEHCRLHEHEIHDAIDAERVSADRLDAWRERLSDAEIASLEAHLDGARRDALERLLTRLPPAFRAARAGVPAP